MIRLACRLAMGLLVLVMSQGCASDPHQGYAHVSPYDTSIETIAVPVFDNVTYEPQLETVLSEAIIKEVHRSTPWRVVPRGQAQTLLSGTITGWRLEPLATQRDSGLVQELAVMLTVSFEWRDLRSGEVKVARRDFRASSAFVPAQGASERLDLGERAAADRLARELVAELRTSAW